MIDMEHEIVLQLDDFTDGGTYVARGFITSSKGNPIINEIRIDPYFNASVYVRQGEQTTGTLLDPNTDNIGLRGHTMNGEWILIAAIKADKRHTIPNGVSLWVSTMGE